MENEITIVTMYYDIYRDASMEKRYLDYFDFWAGLDNELIVFTNNEMKNKIQQIRHKHGRGEKTQVIVIEDFCKIEHEIYIQLKKLDEKNIEDLWHYMPNKRFCADYEYKELMKYWCLKEAVERYNANGMVAWLDFGYNHAGEYYTNTSEFNCVWRTNLSKEHIHIFAFSELNTFPIVGGLQLSLRAAMGGVTVLWSDQTKLLYNLIKQAVEILLVLEIFDTDSRLLLLAYKLAPEVFEVHVTDGWFKPFEIIEAKKEFSTKESKHDSVTGMDYVKHLGCRILGRTVTADFFKRFKKLVNMQDMQKK